MEPRNDRRCYLYVLLLLEAGADVNSKGYDDYTALKWAAEAQSKPGVSYYNGQGVQQDYKEAVKWLKLADEQGHAEAQQVLSRF